MNEPASSAAARDDELSPQSQPDAEVEAPPAESGRGVETGSGATEGGPETTMEEQADADPAPIPVKADADEQEQPVGDQPSGPSPGALLRAAREAAGMSIEELVGETKLSRSNILALENDEFSNLPKPVYVKGYYRKCAQVLNADAEAIAAAYAAAVGTEPAPEPVPFTLPESTNLEFGESRRGGGMLSSLMFVLILGSVVGGLAFWYLSSNDKQADSREDSSVMEMPLDPFAAPESAAQQSALTDLLGSPTETPSTTAPAEPPAPETAAEEDTSEVAASEESEAPAAEESVAQPAVAQGDGDLEIRFDQACWTDIRDANGERLLFGLIEAGNTHRVGGAKPYRILLGNPEGVALQFGGRNIDLAPHTRANKTAVFSLGG